MTRVVLTLVLLLAACRTATPVAEPQPAEGCGWFSVIEGLGEDLIIERMHSASDGYLVLATNGATWEILRLTPQGKCWEIAERKAATEDYLWPSQ